MKCVRVNKGAVTGAAVDDECLPEGDAVRFKRLRSAIKTFALAQAGGSRPGRVPITRAAVADSV